MDAPLTFGSINEENVYKALTQLKIEFDYQYSIDGGRAVRGGQVIDFILWIPPKPIALYVQGEYWHRQANQLEDNWKQIRAEQSGFELLMVDERDCETVEQTTEFLQSKIL